MLEVVIFVATVIALIIVLRKLPVDVDKVSDSTRHKKSSKTNNLREEADEHFEKGELKKAESAYVKLLKQEPQDATLYNKLGLVYLENKDYKYAKSALAQALKLEPENDTFYNNLGLLYYETGRYSDAIEAYKQSIDINDKIASRLVNLGLAYFMNKKYRKAADQYERAIILDPRNETYIDLLKKAEEKLK